MHCWREVLKEGGEVPSLKCVENLTDLAAGWIWWIRDVGGVTGFDCCIGRCDG